MLILAFIALAGAVVVLSGFTCVKLRARRPEDVRIRGVHIVLIATIGYLAIAASGFASAAFGIQLFTVLTHVLVGLGTVFTIYLIRRAMEVEFWCPLCFVNWGINAALFLVSIRTFINWMSERGSSLL